MSIKTFLAWIKITCYFNKFIRLTLKLFVHKLKSKNRDVEMR